MVSIKHFTSFGVFLGLSILSMGQATAADLPEAYVAFYGGVTVPQPFQDVKTFGESTGLKLSNLDLARSAVYGAKLGLFQADPISWLGIETEVFYTNPHVKQQDVDILTLGLPSGSLNLAGAHVRITTWALNWVVRYTGKRFQP